MATDLNDLPDTYMDFDDDPIDDNLIDNDPGSVNQDDNPDDNPDNLDNPDETDLTTEILKIRGIIDPSKIKFEDESGAVIERDWNSLSREEQLNIIADSSDPERDLDDAEIELINTIRESKLSPKDYIAKLQQDTKTEIESQYHPNYKVDEIDDDNLYALDIMRKIGAENITEEELQRRVDQAKENPTLYKKEVEALRATYKQMEDQMQYQKQQEALQQEEAAYQDFANSILSEIDGFNTSSEVFELDTDDKNELANFILTRDDDGLTDFGKVLNNPKTFTTAALWYLKGNELMNEMQNQIREAYKRGFELGSKGTSTNGRVTVQKPSNQTPNTNMSMIGVDFDEGAYIN